MRDSKGKSGFPVWFEWSCENWGTKWNATSFSIEKDEANRLECFFKTAWMPPGPVFKKMGEMFPALLFELRGSEPTNECSFSGTIRGGEMQDLVWETVDPSTGEKTPYSGYLAPHVDRIREMHASGASTLAIAEALYEAGARAQTSGPFPVKLTRADHLINLRAMVIYIERRLGLRIRRYRVLNLKPVNEKSGAPGVGPDAPNLLMR